MADVIQFNCPACGTTLRLPLALAAHRGPCPCCLREIVAPDPHRGVGAHETRPPDQPPLPESFHPFAEPLPPIAPESTATTGLVAPVPPPPAPPRRTPLALPILLTAVSCLIAGYLLGTRSNPPLSRAPLPVLPPPAPDPPAPPTPAPLPEPAPLPTKTPEPVKASAAAQSALMAFLAAPDWTTRSAHVLAPETVRPAMEAYSHQVPDGPTPFTSISVQNSYTDKTTGETLFIFQVVTAQHPAGIPVAVAESPTGWRVDWAAFVEFRDDRFTAFADGPPDQTGRFHLIVSAPPAPRAASAINEHFTSFLLDPPLPGRQRLAYVGKSLEIHATLSAATANGAAFTPVLELVKRNTPTGKSYLEIVGILANDWLPRITSDPPAAAGTR